MVSLTKSKRILRSNLLITILRSRSTNTSDSTRTTKSNSNSNSKVDIGIKKNNHLKLFTMKVTKQIMNLNLNLNLRPDPKPEHVSFGIVFFLSLYAYLSTVSPSIAGGDSGELVAEGCQLGTSHPPGYPLYTILVYFITKLKDVYVYLYAGKEAESVSIAWMVNVTSCFFGSLASALLASSIVLLLQEKRGATAASPERNHPYHPNNKTLNKDAKTKAEEANVNEKTYADALKSKPSKPKANNPHTAHTSLNKKMKIVSHARTHLALHRNVPAAILHETTLHIISGTTMGMFQTLSPLAWQYSTTAEVFALHNLFVSLIIYTCVKFAIEKSLWYFLQGAFVCGLALTNQHTSILLSVPMIFWVIYSTQMYNYKKWTKTVHVHTSIRPVALAVRSGFRILGLRLGPRKKDEDANEKTSVSVPLPTPVSTPFQCNIMLLAAAAFLSSILVLYGTLPLFATLYPHAGSWGDVKSIIGFIHHFRRKDYGTLQLFSGDDEGSEGMWMRIYLWVRDFVWEQSSSITLLDSKVTIPFILEEYVRTALSVSIPTRVCIRFPFVAICFVAGCRTIWMKERKKRSGRVQFMSRRQLAKRIVKDRKGGGIDNDNNGDDLKMNITSGLELDGPSVEVGLLGSLLFYLFVFSTLANLPLNNPLFFGVHQRFWMHPNLLAFLFAGLGMNSIIKFMSDRYSSHCPNIATILIVGIPSILIAMIFKDGLLANDQSDNYHLQNYARSILMTLPANATLFINYDQQWTSIRYLQECEAVRKDITSIHIGMMSYPWWQHKRDLYSQVKFPGTHNTKANTVHWKNGGFTFSELIDVNYSGSSGIFIGGKLTHSDPNYLRDYAEIPHGIVSQIVKQTDTNPSPEAFRVKSQKVWKKVIEEYARGFPDTHKYGEDTWEQTIVREFFDHYVTRATHLLDLVVSGDPQDMVLASLVESCAWLELAHLNDPLSSKSSGLWKNLGLCYMRAVQNQETKIPIFNNFMQGEHLMKYKVIDIWWDHLSADEEWKTWASKRWQHSWGKFLHMDDAKEDQSYESVKSIFETVTKSIVKA